MAINNTNSKSLIAKTNNSERREEPTRRKLSGEGFIVGEILGCKEDPGGGESQEPRRAWSGEFEVDSAAKEQGGESQESSHQEPGAMMGQEEGPGGMTQELKAASFSVLYNYIKARQGQREIMQMLIVVCC